MQPMIDRMLNGRWLIGGLFVLFGFVLLLSNIGVIGRVHVWDYWPLIFVGIGIHKIVQPFKRSEGFWWLALGAWFLVNTLRLWDLHWGDTWPAVLIILGLTWMWESYEKESLKRKQSEHKAVEL